MSRCVAVVMSPCFPLVFGLFMQTTFAVGTFKVIGIFANEMSTSLNMTATDIGIILGLFSLFLFFPVPISIAIYKRCLNKRLPAIVGALLFSTGIATASFASSNAYVAACLSISGIGGMAMYVFFTLSLHEHTDNFNLLFCLASAGCGVAMVLPPLLAQVLLSAYGWRSAMLLYGTLSANIIPCIMTVRTNSGPSSNDIPEKKHLEEKENALDRRLDTAHDNENGLIETMSDGHTDHETHPERITDRHMNHDDITEREPRYGESIAQKTQPGGSMDQGTQPDKIAEMESRSDGYDETQPSGVSGRYMYLDEQAGRFTDQETKSDILAFQGSRPSGSSTDQKAEIHIAWSRTITDEGADDWVGSYGSTQDESAPFMHIPREGSEIISTSSKSSKRLSQGSYHQPNNCIDPNNEEEGADYISGVKRAFIQRTVDVLKMLPFVTDPWGNFLYISYSAYAIAFIGWHSFLIPHAIQLGISPYSTLVIIFFAALGNFGGRVCAGLLTRELVAPVDLYLALCPVNVLALVCYAFVSNRLVMVTMSFLSGMCIGGKAALPYLIGRGRVRPEEFSIVFGTGEFIFGISCMIGDYCSGLIADYFGSYSATFMLLAIMELLCLILILPVKLTSPRIPVSESKT